MSASPINAFNILSKQIVARDFKMVGTFYMQQRSLEMSCLSWFPVNLASTEALGFITDQDCVRQDELLMNIDR